MMPIWNIFSTEILIKKVCNAKLTKSHPCIFILLLVCWSRVSVIIIFKVPLDEKWMNKLINGNFRNTNSLQLCIIKRCHYLSNHCFTNYPARNLYMHYKLNETLFRLYLDILSEKLTETLKQALFNINLFSIIIKSLNFFFMY